MHIAYMDESGDDGYPAYSSELFALSAVYLPTAQWRNTFDRVKEFRRDLRDDFGLPVKTELHTKYLLLGKRPYRALGLSESDRIAIMDKVADLIGALDLRVVNVVIVKPRLTSSKVSVLDRAVTFAVQRIENDLREGGGAQPGFVLVTDEGRVGAMRGTTRRLQRFNYIPSKFGGSPYRADIETMIEDPLPKNSRESYFVQLADFVALVVYHYVHHMTGHGTLHGRTPATVDEGKILDWMGRMKPSLNTKAARKDPFGVKIYPD